MRQQEEFVQELFSKVHWVSDTRLVFGSTESYGAFGASFLTGKIYSIDLDGGGLSLLQAPWAGNPKGFHILRVLQDDPEHIVTADYYLDIGTWNASKNGDKSPSAYLINTEGSTYKAATRWGHGMTPNGHRIMTSPLPNGGLAADSSGRVRLAWGFDPDSGEDEAMYRPVGGNWQAIPGTFSGLMGTGVVGFDADGQHIYVLDYADKPDTLALYRLDPKTGKKTLVFHDPNAGIDDMIFGAGGKKLAAIETMYGLPKLTLIDKGGPVAKILSAFSRGFPGQYPQIVSWSRNGDKAVVDVSSDRNPGQYYLVDVKSMKASKLFSRQPDINPADMARMRPIEFKARDGMLIHGYLTLPNGTTGKNLPMIVYVHGGPYTIRDTWGFDPWVQLLANRGYAVLQVNYRGSIGYGWNYQKAGFRHWGTTMQYDVIDATKWAIKQGYANANRVCIFGGSYGGFAAIRSAEIAPDLYKCTVGYDGVYDLNMMYDNEDSFGTSAGVYFLHNVLAKTEKERAENSPVNHVGRLTGGIFLVQGGADKIVRPEQAEELKDRLDRAGKHYTYFYREHELHGFRNVDNERELAKSLLAFFGHWIGPDSASQKAVAAAN
ncbi:MAG TPA: prolyl oligopeptidase family serine peptidase [Gammaproteobacteria bacterium]|nr:prolyl oligopeptidase family serine peptidase [Gammaproteobacteria bacterium]